MSDPRQSTSGGKDDSGGGRDRSLARLLERQSNGATDSEDSAHSSGNFPGTTDAYAEALLKTKQRETKKKAMPGSKRTTTAEDHDQNEMEELVHQFEASKTKPDRSTSMREASRSDRDLLNAMLGDQVDGRSSSTESSTPLDQSGAVFESTIRVGVAHEASNMIDYQEDSRSLPFATAGVNCTAEVSKEAEILGGALSGATSYTPDRHLAIQTEGVSKETMMLTDVISKRNLASGSEEPSRLDRFLSSMAAKRTAPLKESKMNHYANSSAFPTRGKGTTVRIPSSPSIVTVENSRSDLEAGQAEVDTANHQHATGSSGPNRQGSPVPSRSTTPTNRPAEQSTHTQAPLGGNRRSSHRNFPRAEQPGAVPMEGRAFGLAPNWPQYSRRDCMESEMRGSTTTASTFSLVSFFSDGLESIVQATAVDDISVVVADVIRVKRMPRKCKICFCSALFIIFVIAGIFLGAFLGSGSNGSVVDEAPTHAPTPMPTVQLDELVVALEGVSSLEDLTTIGTPQHSASFWLANQDGLDLPWTAPASQALIQRYVLVVLYFATQGEVGWRTQGGWLDPDAQECDWGPSIACRQGQAVSLELNRNNLTGRLPHELKFLSHLEGLHLSGNNLTGSLPETIADLTSLHMIRLNDNKITGTIPDFGGLSALSSLDLSGNHLTGALKENFFGLQKLRSLDLSFNRLTGTISGKFGDLRYLSKVDLRNNHFGGAIPSDLMRMEDVAFLHLDNNELTGTLPLFYDAILRKEKVSVSNNRLSGTISIVPSSVDTKLGFTSTWKTGDLRLREIDFSNNLFGGTISDHFQDLPTLRKIDLSGNLFHGNVLGFAGSNLEYVDFSRNAFDGSLPETFGESLTFIDYSENNLFGTIPPGLQGLDYIESINLSGNGVAGSLPAAKAWIGSLRHLNVSNCDISGPIPESYGDLSRLEVLDLRGNRMDGSIPVDLADLQELRHMDFTSNVLTGKLPSRMGRMNELSTLMLSDNEISGSLPESFGRLVKLETLRLDRNRMTGSVPDKVCSALDLLMDDSEQVRLSCDMECSCCGEGVVPECEAVKDKEDTSS